MKNPSTLFRLATFAVFVAMIAMLGFIAQPSAATQQNPDAETQTFELRRETFAQVQQLQRDLKALQDKLAEQEREAIVYNWMCSVQRRPIVASDGLVSDRVLIHWHIPTSTANGYQVFDFAHEIFRAECDGNGKVLPETKQRIGEVAGDVGSFNDVTAAPGRKYGYRIYRYPVNPNGVSAQQAGHQWMHAGRVTGNKPDQWDESVAWAIGSRRK